VDRQTLNIGILYGVGAAVFWGSSAIFIKLGLEKGGSPVGGSLIAYLVASMTISPSLLNRDKRKEILYADKKSFHLALVSGLTTNVAQFLRFLALEYGSVIMVTLLSRTTPSGYCSFLLFLIENTRALAGGCFWVTACDYWNYFDCHPLKRGRSDARNQTFRTRSSIAD